jgi:hypothetical protein
VRERKDRIGFGIFIITGGGGGGRRGEERKGEREFIQSVFVYCFFSCLSIVVVEVEMRYR